MPSNELLYDGHSSISRHSGEGIQYCGNLQSQALG